MFSIFFGIFRIHEQQLYQASYLPWNFGHQSSASNKNGKLLTADRDPPKRVIHTHGLRSSVGDGLSRIDVGGGVLKIIHALCPV